MEPAHRRLPKRTPSGPQRPSNLAAAVKYHGGHPCVYLSYWYTHTIFNWKDGFDRHHNMRDYVSAGYLYSPLRYSSLLNQSCSGSLITASVSSRPIVEWEHSPVRGLPKSHRCIRYHFCIAYYHCWYGRPGKDSLNLGLPTVRIQSPTATRP